MIEKIEYSTLPYGLRVVVRPLPGEVEYCGIAVNAGSRDELSPSTHGLAHFVEHTIFKGTARRKAWHILNRMETVGGELNAYTTKEETLIYSTFPAGNLSRAAELIADLVAGSRFPAAEINREREVVADEINSYLDVPSEGIYDDFEDLIFAGTPMGHNILGSIDSIAGFTPEVCRRYLDTFYTPGQMVFFYSGPMGIDRVTRIVDRYFSVLSLPDTPRRREFPPVAERFDIVRETGTHQAHVVMGARTGGMMDGSRWAMSLLTNILGGPGMNSLFNVALRERRGLVYTIDASTSLLSDTGLFTVYFGCDPADTARCRRLIENIVTETADKGLTPRRLAEAKRQYTGQLLISSTNAEQMALSTGRGVLFYGHASTVAEAVERYNAVDNDAIRSAAAMLTSMSVLTMR